MGAGRRAHPRWASDWGEMQESGLFVLTAMCLSVCAWEVVVCVYALVNVFQRWGKQVAVRTEESDKQPGAARSWAHTLLFFFGHRHSVCSSVLCVRV